MWNTKLCLNTNEEFNIPIEEQIKLFKRTGFEAFFTKYSNPYDIAKFKKVADSEGMIYQSVHSPFFTLDKMWEEEKVARETIDTLKECVGACADNDIGIMVAHAFIGFEAHSPNEFGIKHFDEVVLEAERRGIKIAFENTEGEEYLAAIMEYFKGSDAVGFCFDSGHEMCYNHSKDMLNVYGDRLLCTHLNDNLGISDYNGKITPLDDLHMLPFDGAADWQGIIDRLSKCNYDGILTFELKIGNNLNRHESDIYRQMPIEMYIAEAYKRACRVAMLKHKTKKELI